MTGKADLICLLQMNHKYKNETGDWNWNTKFKINNCQKYKDLK